MAKNLKKLIKNTINNDRWVSDAEMFEGDPIWPQQGETFEFVSGSCVAGGAHRSPPQTGASHMTP